MPFTFYQEGGYSGDNGFVWPGMFANIVSILILGALIAIAHKLFSGEKST